MIAKGFPDRINGISHNAYNLVVKTPTSGSMRVFEENYFKRNIWGMVS